MRSREVLIYLNATSLAWALLISDNAAFSASNLWYFAAHGTDGKNDMEYLSAIGGLVILLVIGVGGLIMLYLIWDDARPVDFSRWSDLTATIRTRIGALSPQTAIMVIAVLVAAATVYLVASYGGLQSERAESAPLAAVAAEAPPAPPPPAAAAVNMAAHGVVELMRQRRLSGELRA